MENVQDFVRNLPEEYQLIKYNKILKLKHLKCNNEFEISIELFYERKNDRICICTLCNSIIITTSTLTFVGKKLELLIGDRTDPVFLLFLAQVEHSELYNGDGLLWYKHLKENYGVRFGDEKTETRIENMLISNRKQGISTSILNKDKK